MNEFISAEALLAKVSAQAEGAELYELRSLELPVTFRAGTLDSVKAVGTAGRAVRAIKEGRLGFSTTTDLTDGTAVVRYALESAQFGDPSGFSFPGEAATDAVQCFDPEVEQLDAQQLIEMGEALVDKIRAYDADLQVDVSLDRGVQEITLLNSSGLERRDRRTLFVLMADATRTREDDILMVGDAAVSRRRQEVDGLALAGRIVEKLRAAETIVEVESKAMPVVFRGVATLALLLPLRYGLNGRQVYLGTSPLGDKLGKPVFDSRFSLLDDGRLDYASRSAPFDDEGTPTREKRLIDGGTVRQFLYDLKTAALAGAEPTGNGFKYTSLFEGGFEALPETVPATWVVPPGEWGLGTILGDLDEALLVDDVIGLGQGNVLAGEFSNNVGLGFLVRRGEIVGRVKNTMIAGNVYELLRDQLIALSSEPEWVYGLVHSPAIAVDGVSVVSKG